MSTTIVIPAWAYDPNTRTLTEETIRNIADTAPTAQLAVVYAGIPPSKTIASVPDVFLEVNPPQGWAAATNMGILTTTSDHVVVGSIDIRLGPGWLTALVEAAGTIRVASPLDVRPDGARRRWDRTMRGSFWGGWFCFHRTILDTIGYFDGYTMRVMADMDWAVRARHAGYETVRVDVAAVHVQPHHSRSQPDPYYETMQAVFRSRHGVDRYGELEGLPPS